MTYWLIVLNTVFGLGRLGSSSILIFCASSRFFSLLSASSVCGKSMNDINQELLIREIKWKLAIQYLENSQWNHLLQFIQQNKCNSKNKIFILNNARFMNILIILQVRRHIKSNCILRNTYSSSLACPYVYQVWFLK